MPIITIHCLMPLLFTQLELAAQLQRARETQLVNGCQIFIDVHSKCFTSLKFQKYISSFFISCVVGVVNVCGSNMQLAICMEINYKFVAVTAADVGCTRAHAISTYMRTFGVDWHG